VQEDSAKTGKVTSAGMFFLGFPVYRFEQNNSVSIEIMSFCLLLFFFVCLFLQAPIATRLLLRRILTVLSLKDWMAFNLVK
jgi:glucan phosphoethanolaminetransferase (alkaline phosphatase superfamily)